MKKLLRSQMKKIYFTCFQKKKKMSNGIELTYLHYKKVKSDQLVVVFSAMTSGDNKYAYNYIRTLKEMSCNRLFILDNFGLEKRGVFYLGENGSMDVRDAVEELIQQIVKQDNIRKTIFSGSSKGAFAALYIGIRMSVQHIIIGSPIVQIKLYLEGIANENALFKTISQSQNNSNLYDELLLDTISEFDYAGKIYLQYSSNEETYQPHTQSLIKQLKQYNYEMELNEQAYLKHEDTRLFFPVFLHEKLGIYIKTDKKN
ncbi:hypothetical protein [Paenilisteria weihenstephanensis]|uniref:Two component regulator three Y domain-containing protein n=1 Tax=Listeria weihenstephanensis TaxID=1006155 RepID=A0A1S7FVE9_9LIST|nr:hypothetical protein [Listeria weihenstephanensis]AQY51337.1 hypothetical protein UE46_09900 [Listeria weihenstephanensis]